MRDWFVRSRVRLVIENVGTVEHLQEVDMPRDRSLSRLRLRRELDAVLLLECGDITVSLIGISIATITLSFASMKRCREVVDCAQLRPEPGEQRTTFRHCPLQDIAWALPAKCIAT